MTTSNTTPMTLTPERLKEIEERAANGPQEEDWRKIPGYEGVYDVSNFGNVRSYLKPGNNLNKKDGRPRVLKLNSKSRKCRITVSLTNDAGIAETKSLPAIVMLAFCGPRPNGMEVAHLNGNWRDNRLSNLKYCTHRENESHKKLHGTAPIGEQNGIAKLCGWKVAEIKYLLDKGIHQRKLCALFDMSPDAISTIATGENWSHINPKQDLPDLLTHIAEQDKEIERLRGDKRRLDWIGNDALRFDLTVLIFVATRHKTGLREAIDLVMKEPDKALSPKVGGGE